jgi:hypothetical protein
MVSNTATRKATVTIPEELLDEIRAEAAERGMSACVAEDEHAAVREDLEGLDAGHVPRAAGGAPRRRGRVKKRTGKNVYRRAVHALQGPVAGPQHVRAVERGVHPRRPPWDGTSTHVRTAPTAAEPAGRATRGKR